MTSRLAKVANERLHPSRETFFEPAASKKSRNADKQAYMFCSCNKGQLPAVLQRAKKDSTSRTTMFMLCKVKSILKSGLPSDPREKRLTPLNTKRLKS